jgi:16S rRNA (guanine1207-N2)-methyltransferase
MELPMDLVEDCASRDFLQALTAEKQLTFTYHRQHLRFQVSQELFSSYQVDTGTQLLLKTTSDLAASDQVNKVLDLGCGYGPLGLAFAAVGKQRHVHLVDRDALAVQFTRANARLNKLNNILAYGSLGYDDVSENKFDLLLSNIPGKAGHPAIESILLDAQHHLNPQGIVAVVVVSPLADPIAEILARPDIELLLREEGSEHVVFHYRFLAAATSPGINNGKNGENSNQTVQVFAPGAFERGVYDRGGMDVDYRGLKFHMQTVRGVPEFDKISHQSELLFSILEKVRSRKKPAQHVLVFNPTQGHVPIAIHKQLDPQVITLVDRDLLALRSSRRNLFTHGRSQENLSCWHQVGLIPDEALPPPDLILGILRDSEGPAANYELVRQAAGLLAPQGQLIISAASTTITRLEKTIKQNKLMTVKQRKRNRAKRLLILEAR